MAEAKDPAIERYLKGVRSDIEAGLVSLPDARKSHKRAIKKSGNAPRAKRPPSGWMLFLAEQRKKLPGSLSQTEKVKRAAALWAEADQDKWNAKAAKKRTTKNSKKASYD